MGGGRPKPPTFSFLLCSASARGPLTFLSAFVRGLVGGSFVLALTFRAVSGRGKRIQGAQGILDSGVGIVTQILKKCLVYSWVLLGRSG